MGCVELVLRLVRVTDDQDFGFGLEKGRGRAWQSQTRIGEVCKNLLF